MITDDQLMNLGNSLGVLLMVLVIVYHYIDVNARPVEEST